MRMVKRRRNLQCLALFVAGHKYFGFDSRRGNEISWRYRAKGFQTSFPRPGLKKLHAEVVKACSTGVLDCVQKLGKLVSVSSIMRNASCARRHSKKRPRDAGKYYPFSSAVDLFRFRTSAMYFMCWHALNRQDMLKHLKLSQCVKGLEKNQEPLGNQKRILDYRRDDKPYQCALLLFCPDPCYGRKTHGLVPSEDFAIRRDPGNPCRGLKDKRCEWNLDHNHNFEALKRNRFNISCQCQKERQGFAWDSRYHLCVDVDECQNKETRKKCGQTKRCQNTVGGYECLCRPGYVRDTKTLQCEEHVRLPQPFINQTLLDARRLRKMLQNEDSVTFLKRQFEIALGLSSGCRLASPNPSLQIPIAGIFLLFTKCSA